MLYADEYGILDMDLIAHAVPLDPCDAEEGWLISVVLSLGPGMRVFQHYPTRALRDQAFERLVTLVQQMEGSLATDEEADPL